MTDLFELRVAAANRHPQFESLRNSPLHQKVREYLNQLFSQMGDPDGSFVYDFQERGFHARAFEMACFAYLRSAGLNVERSSGAPDFIAGNGTSKVVIEVTTANVPQNADQDISVLRAEDFDPFDDSRDFDLPSSDEFPKKIRSRLIEKLKKKYQTLPDAARKPIVLMVAPFFAPGSVAFPGYDLVDALYQTKPHPRTTPFFWLRDATSISAVAYCNAFTMPKFWRLADHDYLAEQCIALRTGPALFEGKDHLSGFRYKIGHEATPTETWHEGVTLFVNPRADFPLPANFLPASCTYACEDGMVRPHVTGFHPLHSRMRVFPRA
jgi:hypothetical protein